MGSDKSGQPNYVQPKIICSFVPIHLTVNLSTYILLFMNIPPQNGKTILDLLHEQIMVQDGRKKMMKI